MMHIERLLFGCGKYPGRRRSWSRSVVIMFYIFYIELYEGVRAGAVSIFIWGWKFPKTHETPFRVGPRLRFFMKYFTVLYTNWSFIQSHILLSAFSTLQGSFIFIYTVQFIEKIACLPFLFHLRLKEKTYCTGKPPPPKKIEKAFLCPVPHRRGMKTGFIWCSPVCPQSLLCVWGGGGQGQNLYLYYKAEFFKNI
jgi:hypothetical protein